MSERSPPCLGFFWSQSIYDIVDVCLKCLKNLIHAVLTPSPACCSCIIKKQIVFHTRRYVTAEHSWDLWQRCGIISPLMAHPRSGVMAGRYILSDTMVYHRDNKPEDGAGASPWRPRCLHPDQCTVSTTPSPPGKKRRRCKDGNGLLGLCTTGGKEMVSFPKKTIS